MQTFLPSSNFRYCAQVIDNKRLWKQILEANQIFNILSKKTDGGRYKSHPAIKMWDGYLDCLLQYRNIFVEGWMERRLSSPPSIKKDFYAIPMPKWLDDERLFSSHRSALLAKNYDYYSKFGWKESPEIKYFWPI